MTQAGEQNYAAAKNYIDSGAGTWDASKAAAYANPFKSQVQADTLKQMDLQDENADAALADQAQAAKAYGGTRFAVQQAQQTKDQALAKSNYIDSSNASAYDTARSEFDTDQARAMQQYQTLAAMLAATPRNTTSTGTASGTQVQQTDPGLLNTMLGLGSLGISAYTGGVFKSDRRAKRDIQWLDNLDNGLGVYRFNYHWDDADEPPRIGVMADEVERIMPEALGPIVDGYRTVDYSKIGELVR